MTRIRANKEGGGDKGEGKEIREATESESKDTDEAAGDGGGEAHRLKIGNRHIQKNPHNHDTIHMVKTKR